MSLSIRGKSEPACGAQWFGRATSAASFGSGVAKTGAPRQNRPDGSLFPGWEGQPRHFKARNWDGSPKD